MWHKSFIIYSSSWYWELLNEKNVNFITTWSRTRFYYSSRVYKLLFFARLTSRIVSVADFSRMKNVKWKKRIAARFSWQAPIQKALGQLNWNKKDCSIKRLATFFLFLVFVFCTFSFILPLRIGRERAREKRQRVGVSSRRSQNLLVLISQMLQQPPWLCVFLWHAYTTQKCLQL